MKPEEAKKVLGIMMSADEGCQYCVGGQFEGFLNVFPEFEQLAHDIYLSEFTQQDWDDIVKG